jgi:hypothetical protein
VEIAAGGGGGQDRECGLALVAEGHLDRVVGGRCSGAVIGVGDRPASWGCGHAKEGGDDEDGHGQGGFEPDRPYRHPVLLQAPSGEGGGGEGAGNQGQLDHQAESVAAQPQLFDGGQVV